MKLSKGWPAYIFPKNNLRYHTNAEKIIVGKDEIALKVGRTAKINAKAVKQ